MKDILSKFWTMKSGTGMMSESTESKVLDKPPLEFGNQNVESLN